MAASRDKALRLLAQGSVEPDAAPVTMFTVHGDTSTYQVFVGAHVALCTCPAPARCSHIEAAVLWANADGAEKGLMQAALERRKADEREAADALFARLGA